MPDGSPTHIRRRRLTIRRVLLAIVLGLAAWWGMGWWLSPRPLYTLRYPDSSKITSTTTDLTQVSFHVGVDDQSRLRVERPHISSDGQVTFEQYDLATGTLLGLEVCNASEYSGHSLKSVGTAIVGPYSYVVTPPRAVRRFPPEETRLGHFMIPGTRQSVCIAAHFSLGDYLDGLISHAPWFAELVSRRSVGVLDEDQRHLLWSLPIDYEHGGITRFFMARSKGILVVHQLQCGWHEVAVLAVPLPSNSPWWPRFAGLLIAVPVLLARRRLAWVRSELLSVRKR